MPAPPPNVTIRSITAAQTHPLRLAVLRAGMPPDAAVFPGDDLPSTQHLGAFDDEQLIGIASLMRGQRPKDDWLADRDARWPDDLDDDALVRLRGMAVAPDARGRGIGAALLEACIQHARDSNAALLWCVARTPAFTLYQRQGLTTHGSPFDIPTAGPHHLMSLPLRQT